MMNVTDYTNIKTLLIKFKEKSDVLYAKAAALSNYATIEWVGTQIPSVGNGTVTIKQNGTSKGSFTMNQSGGATINLADTTYSSLSAVSGGTDKSLVTTGEKYTWNSKQAAISDLATIRTNAATAYGWGDHSKAGYITGITKAMVESVLTGNIASHTHTFASLTSKPTTLSGYGITDALPLNGTAANAAQLGGKAASMYFVNNNNRGAVDFDTQFINGFEYVSGLSTNGGVPYAIIYTAMQGDAGMQANFGRDCALQYRSRGGSRWFDWRTVYDDHNSNNTSTVWSAKRLVTPDNLICPYTWDKRDSLTGTLVLSLPYGFNSMVQSIELTVYDYAVKAGNGGATKFFINGYSFHSSNSRWVNPYAFRIGNKNVKVRLGLYNNKCCILIGETNTTWTDPGLSVDKIYGFSGIHANHYKDDDWSCAVLQDESQITDIATATDTPLYAPCYTRAGLPYVTDNDVATKYLKLTGGTITGSIKLDGDYISIVPFVRNFKSENTGGWSRSIIEFLVDNKNAFRIAAFGDYTPKAENNKIQYAHLGFADYGGLNLRISETSLSWGDNVIYHAGNCNLPTIPWKCSSLTANGSVEAKANLYGQSLEFSNISSSANHGGFIDFHFNGSTADYTSRIIEDAAGQLTLRAKEIVVPGVVHATIGIYTDGYISAKQASTSSDRRLKTDFRSIDNALKYVLNTHYTRFRWKDDNKESIGIIAQEEQNREYGFLVQNRKEIGHLTYDYAASTALLGAAIQEEDSKVEKLRKRIIKLENELSNLKKKWQH